MAHSTSTIPYTFKAKPWQYSGKGAWIFVSLPEDISAEIRTLMGKMEQGWGRLTATAKIGNTEWQSAIWWDSKHKTYLLPLKADIRKKEKIEIGKEIKVIVKV